MGLTIEASLDRFGFVPAGGGRIRFDLPGGQTPAPVDLLERGEEEERRIHCLTARIPGEVARKETNALRQDLDWPEKTVFVESPENSDCPGNVLAAEISHANVTERVSAFGAHGKPSKRVAHEVAKMMKGYLDSGAVVGRHLADQILLPMALSGGGKIHTAASSNHVKTNREVIETFLPVRFHFEPEFRGCQFVSVRR